MIHIEKDEQNDKDQEKGKEENKKKIYLEKILEAERGKEKDYQNDEKIIDPRGNQGSHPFGHGEPTNPIQEIGVRKFSEFGREDHEG